MADLWFAPGDLLYEPLSPCTPPFIVLSIDPDTVDRMYAIVTILDVDGVCSNVSLCSSQQQSKYRKVDL